MQDSFQSIKDIGAEKWVVNVRGKYKFETLFFLHDNLGDKLVPYMLESKEGWFHDTKYMLNDIDTDYVFFWIEDHINIADPAAYKEILDEMKKDGVEYMCYSWWHFGKLREPYKDIEKKERKHISTFLFDKKARKKMHPKKIYIISTTGFLSQELFKRIINTPIFFRIFPKVTPFHFEKPQRETKWLPIKYALPKYELFASIDDDQGDEGYSLQARGLYPNRVPRTEDQWKEGQKINQNAKWRIFYRVYIKKYMPSYAYRIKNRIGKSARRSKKFFSLFIKRV